MKVILTTKCLKDSIHVILTVDDSWSHSGEGLILLSSFIGVKSSIVWNPIGEATRQTQNYYPLISTS